MSDHAQKLLDGANKARCAGDHVGADLLMYLLERELERTADANAQIEMVMP